jgi:hypothetical protein
VSDYREHQPTEALKSFVECFWTRVGGPGLEARILPDGAVDVIFDLAASSPSTSAFVVGTMTAPVVVKPLRTCDYVAIRFQPGGAQPLFGGSMREWTDRRVDLGSLWSPQVASEWTECLGDVESPSVRVQILERLLTRRIPELPSPELRVRESIRRIKQSRGSLIVESLRPTLGLTRQP